MFGFIDPRGAFVTLNFMDLLLASGGMRTEERLKAWRDELDTFLGDIKSFVFIPYAIQDYDAYTEGIKNANLHVGREVLGIHQANDAKRAIEETDALMVGGGNTFRLLKTMYDEDLISLIRKRVQSGMKYFGASAGSNLACPTIKTTNDMPITMPPSFEALNLIPFQINPHFFSGSFFFKTGSDYVEYAGETREKRLEEFHEMNAQPVLGLWEGSILLRHGNRYQLTGSAGARLLRQGQEPVDFEPGADLTSVLAPA